MNSDKDIEQRFNRAKREFIDIVNTYMLPLFDTRGALKCVTESSNSNELITILQKEGTGKSIRFYPCISSKRGDPPFYCEIGTYSSSALKKPATNILRELLKATEYEYCSPFHVKRYYGKKSSRQISYKARTLDLAFELGMCQWLAPTEKDAITLHTIVCRMIEWSSRTYEGKNVPFGIVIDFDLSKDNAADYLHFLENDSSAVFTDGIFSGIMLEKSGKIVRFLTRSSAPSSQKTEQEIFVPYQFVDIAKHCTNNAIGIITLTNGEILLIKNHAVCFAKRGRKWVYFDWTRVYTNIRPYFLPDADTNEEIIYSKIKSIYCTLLDVSFAHTGGCLAIVHPDKADSLNDEKIVSERLDLYSAGSPIAGMSAESKEKAEVLSYLLRYSEQQLQSFFELDKPLRREILSLDGATVVSLNGSFYCAGSIVSVPSGSSSGGRSAAAKQLAKYGVGIKISEDGYIEAYGVPVNSNGSLNTLANCRIIPLFKFK